MKIKCFHVSPVTVMMTAKAAQGGWATGQSLQGAQALGWLSVDGKSFIKGKPSIQKAPIERLVLEKLLDVIFA